MSLAGANDPKKGPVLCEAGRAPNVAQGGLHVGGCPDGVALLINARGEEAIKIGMIEPLTGVYAHLAKAEVAGAELAAAEVDRSGGILGRQVQLLVKDLQMKLPSALQKPDN